MIHIPMWNNICALVLQAFFFCLWETHGQTPKEYYIETFAYIPQKKLLLCMHRCLIPWLYFNAPTIGVCIFTGYPLSVCGGGGCCVWPPVVVNVPFMRNLLPPFSYFKRASRWVGSCCPGDAHLRTHTVYKTVDFITENLTTRVY